MKDSVHDEKMPELQKNVIVSARALHRAWRECTQKVAVYKLIKVKE